MEDVESVVYLLLSLLLCVRLMDRCIGLCAAVSLVARFQNRQF